jgi:type IV pilus assembly protein PilB
MTLPPLAKFFVDQKWDTLENVTSWVQTAQTDGKRLIDVAWARKKPEISGFDALTAISQNFSIPVVYGDFIATQTLPQEVVDLKILQKQRIIPLFVRQNFITFLTDDPSSLALTLRELRMIMKQSVSLVLTDPVWFQKTFEKYVQPIDTTGSASSSSNPGSNLDNFSIESLTLEEVNTEETQSSDSNDVDDAPVVRLVHKILYDAIREGASDIHFEPFETGYRVRFRRDGVLGTQFKLPSTIKDKISSRIKVMSRLDISEKRVPQDGRMKLRVDAQRSIDFRISTLPTLFGEKVVMRILDPSSAKLGIEALGYEPEQKTALLDAVKRPYGMVLVTGPTGSGKTVSLYTCLNILNDEGVNISTAEDPSEINLYGINQVNVNNKAGLTFAAALKSFLRQDPDVIMVGEIRDLETADISIKAAQTGHMVLSTLHTNDAPTTITRLANMGVAAFNIASSVILITAQRLARKLCTCKKEVPLSPAVLEKAGFNEKQQKSYGTEWKAYHPVGCENCKHTGYKGRVGLYQVMPISEKIQELILAGGTSLDIARASKEDGVLDLREAGLLKVMRGLTSLEEVVACTNE